MPVWIEWRSIRFRRPDLYEIESVTHYAHPARDERPASEGSLAATTYLGLTDVAAMHPELLPFAWWAKQRWLVKMRFRRPTFDRPPPGPWIPIHLARPPRIDREPPYTPGQPYRPLARLTRKEP